MTTDPANPSLARPEHQDPGAQGSGRGRLVRILLVIAAVLLAAEVAVRAFSVVLPEPLVFYDAVPQAKNHQLTRVAAEGGADVVIAGPSSAFLGVDAELLGAGLSTPGKEVLAYNAGVTAGIPELSSEWLDQFVLPRTHPEAIVWVLSSLDLNPGSLAETSLGAYRNSLAVRDDRGARVERWLGKISDLIRYRHTLRSADTWVDLARGKTDPVEFWAASMSPLGTGLHQDLPLNETARRQAASALAEFELGGAPSETILEAARSWQADGIDVVLAEAPIPNRTVALHPNGAADIAAARAELRSLARRSGSSVITIGERFRDDSLFQDYTHMNREGARAYTRYLAERLDDGAGEGS